MERSVSIKPTGDHCPTADTDSSTQYHSMFFSWLSICPILVHLLLLGIQSASVCLYKHLHIYLHIVYLNSLMHIRQYSLLVSGGSFSTAKSWLVVVEMLQETSVKSPMHTTHTTPALVFLIPGMW